jgi:hypothetical protein
VSQQSVSAMAYSKGLPKVFVTTEKSQYIFRKEECFKILSKDFQKLMKKKTHSLPILSPDGSSLLFDSPSHVK